MALGPRLDLRQSQSLVMTPQLQQAIKLLALSNLEVEAFIAEEIDRNPLLEIAAEDAGDRNDPTGDHDGLDADTRSAEAPLLEVREGGGNEAQLDVDFTAETFHHDSVADGGPDDRGMGTDGGLSLNGGPTGGSGVDGDGFDFDSVAADAPSLHDHLLGQAGEVFSGTRLLVAQHLIDQIDEAGYLSVGLLDMANRLGVPRMQVEAVLDGIQRFDPTGVGARDLAECLRLQVIEADRHDPAMARLLDNLDLLAAGKLNQIKRICDVDDEDLSDMIRELRTYDPKPGLRFGGERSGAVTPDLFVVERKEGWSVEINSATLPRVLVNRSYYRELSNGGSTKDSRAWLGDALANANWLVKALDQRQRTILKVAAEIVKHQEGFFRHGVAQLKPLTLRMVADAITMHESTVSRVTSAKYLSCARGVFELKFFFSNAVGGKGEAGEGASSEAIRNALKALITAEGEAVLADDQLVELLSAQGFDIARRTVAKYREAMGFGSSVQRRRARALAG
jgi:RNA polymerase sigma-54 factor